MKVLREADGLKFVGQCEPETGFVAEDVYCGQCGRRIEPFGEGNDVALRCVGCGFQGRVFWSEADLHVYLAEHWNGLRNACSDRSDTPVKP